MPSLSTYSAELDYAYAPGMFPAMECLLHRPESCRRVLLHSRSAGTEGAQRLREEAEKHHIRVEEADKALSRISGKDNCFAAAVFSKFEDDLRPDRPHIVLHHPSDSGNVGTIFRTALGFDVQDIAVIRPCVDVFDPKTVRASMGSIFQLRLHVYDDFSQYQAQFPEHALYPFMLDGSKSLPDVLGDIPDRWTLIFGNEGSGLPPEFSRLGQPVRIPSSNKVDSLNLSIAAAIGIYAFARR